MTIVYQRLAISLFYFSLRGLYFWTPNVNVRLTAITVGLLLIEINCFQSRFIRQWPGFSFFLYHSQRVGHFWGFIKQPLPLAIIVIAIFYPQKRQTTGLVSMLRICIATRFHHLEPEEFCSGTRFQDHLTDNGKSSCLIRYKLLDFMNEAASSIKSSLFHWPANRRSHQDGPDSCTKNLQKFI